LNDLPQLKSASAEHVAEQTLCSKSERNVELWQTRRVGSADFLRKEEF